VGSEDQESEGGQSGCHIRGGHMFGFFGSKSIVGLDVGSSSIKAVELKKGRGGLEVAHLGLEALAPDIVVDSMIVDSGTVSRAILKLLAENAINIKNVATVVCEQVVLVTKYFMLVMRDTELASIYA